MTLPARFTRLDPAVRLRIGSCIALLLSLAILYSTLHDRIGRQERIRTSREAVLQEVMVLQQRQREAGAGAQKLANRLAATGPDDSPAKLVEEIGLKGKGSQVKALPGEEHAAYREDAAEVKIEGLTANETVNLIYRLENGSKPVVIKRVNLKTRYDDPARLDLTLTIALLKPLQQEKR